MQRRVVGPEHLGELRDLAAIEHIVHDDEPVTVQVRSSRASSRRGVRGIALGAYPRGGCLTTYAGCYDSPMSTLLLLVLLWIAIDTMGGGAPAQRRTPTFNREVSRILQQHCVSCHRSGDIAPFPLDTYASAREHATAIKKATRSREMPPWMPSECCGTFKGARRLSPADIAVLGAWVDAGAPEGDRRDRPPPLAFDGRWTLGTPDRVLTMAETFTPVSATDVYRCFPIRTGLTSAVYLSALDIQPGIVRWCITSLSTPIRRRRRAAGRRGSATRLPVFWRPGPRER